MTIACHNWCVDHSNVFGIFRTNPQILCHLHLVLQYLSICYAAKAYASSVTALFAYVHPKPGVASSTSQQDAQRSAVGGMERSTEDTAYTESDAAGVATTADVPGAQQQPRSPD